MIDDLFKGLVQRLSSGEKDMPSTISSALGRTRSGANVRFMQRKEAKSLTREDLLDGYNTFPWLRMVIDKISEIAGEVDWMVMRRVEVGDDGRIRREHVDHRMAKLINNGNSLMPGPILRQLTFKYILLVGEAFWMVQRDRAGRPVELWPIPPHWVKETPAINENNRYLIETSGEQVEISSDKIIHMFIPTPDAPFQRGSGPAMTLKDELQADEFAARHAKNFFFNNARPDFVIWSEEEDNEMDNDDVRRMEETWLSKLQGYYRRHTPFFLPGKVGIKEMSSDFGNLGMTDLRKFNRDSVLHMYGLPPEALGILENSNRSTIESAEYFLTKHVVLPRLKFMRAFIQHSLGKEFRGDFEIDFESPVKEDKRHKLRVARSFQWAFSADEIRKMADHEPLEDGKGSIRAVPTNMTLVSDLDNMERLLDQENTPDGTTPEPDQNPDGGDGNTPTDEDQIDPEDEEEEDEDGNDD